jgi:hypothetical protein
MIFWRKIVILHTKYPTNFRASLRSPPIFLSAPPPSPNLISWIRPWYGPHCIALPGAYYAVKTALIHHALFQIS